MLATGVGYAEPVADHVIPFIDHYVESWRAVSMQRCLDDGREDGRGDLNDARAHWCLAERRIELDSLISGYLQADQSMMPNAMSMVSALDLPTSCADSSYLEGHPSPQFDQLREVEVIQKNLARAHNLVASTRPHEALVAAEAGRGRAEMLEWRPLMAAVDYAAGTAYEALQQHERAAIFLERSYKEAAIGGARVLMVDAANLSMKVRSDKLAEHKDAHRWAWLAEIPLATIEPSGGLKSAHRLHYLAGLYEDVGSYRRAADVLKQAIEMEEKFLGAENPKIASLLNNYSALLLYMGDYKEARATAQRALRLEEKALGPRHPGLAPTLISLGNANHRLGRRDEARRHLERALAILEDSFGPDGLALAECLNTLAAVEDLPAKARALTQRALAIRQRRLPADHPDIAKTLNNLAALSYGAGSYPEALKIWQRVAAMQRGRLGPAHPDLALTMLNMGAIYLALGSHAEARASGTRAIAIFKEAGLADNPLIGTALLNLADISHAERKLEEGREYARAALEHFDRIGSASPPDHVGSAMIVLAEVELTAGRPEAAVDPASRALGLWEETKQAPNLIAQARFCLARALWSASAGHGRDRPRALALALQASAGYRETSETSPQIAEIGRWLADRRSK